MDWKTVVIVTVFVAGALGAIALGEPMLAGTLAGAAGGMVAPGLIKRNGNGNGHAPPPAAAPGGAP